MFHPRNLTFFRLSPAVARDVAARLQTAMFERILRSPGPLEFFTAGFVSFERGDVVLALTVPGVLMFRFGTEERVLPSSAINREVQKRVDAIATEEGREVGGRERKRIKENVVTAMLPHTTVRVTYTDCLVDLDDGVLLIDTASRKRAERVVSAVREALGSFPAVPLAPEEGPRVLLTDWIFRRGGDESLPAGVALGDECELRDPATATGAIARYRRQDLDAEEVTENLRNGKQAFRLGLVLEDRQSFVLGEDLVVRKFKLLDVVVDKISYSAAREQELQFMRLELQRLTRNLFAWFNCPRPADA